MLQPFQEMAGVGVSSDGTFKTTYLTKKLPDSLASRDYKQLTLAEQKKADAFYQELARQTGKSVAYLYNNRNLSFPTNGDWTLALGRALESLGLTNSEAFGIANLAGGGAYVKGLLGKMSQRPLTADDYCDPSDLYAFSTPVSVNLEEALLKLKSANPGAHEYAVRVIGAKAAKRQTQEAIQLAQDTQKVIDAELAIAKKVVDIPLNVAEGALDTASALGKAAKYLPWIIGGTVVLVGYLAYRNRGTIATAAKKYYTGGVG